MAALGKFSNPRGWVLYDGECGFCQRWAKVWGPMLGRRGFEVTRLQEPWVAERLKMPQRELLNDLRLLTSDGTALAGADAYLYLMRRIWWAWPLFALFSLPLFNAIFHRGYRWFANNRYCISGACQLNNVGWAPPTRPRPTVGGAHPTTSRPLPWFETPVEIDAVPSRRWDGLIARLPLLALPLAVIFFARDMEPWQFMWLLAFAIYCGCKWLTWWPSYAADAFASAGKSLGYLLLWPGMDPRPFHREALSTNPPREREALEALAKVLFGAALIWIAAPRLPLEAGAWAAMSGILFVLHFGGFHVLALLWRFTGVNVEPVMRAPALATSLAEFWSNRWNTSFSRLAHDEIVRPIKRVMGMRAAILSVFVASGLVHELVISLPARGGYGLPTAYFLLQWCGIAIERSAFGRRVGLQRGLRGWLFVLLFTVAPLYGLFHPPFVHRVIVPFLQALGALDKGGAIMTISLENLLRIGGILQITVLTAAALVPKVLDWKRSLAPLSEFLRKMFWVYGAFIAMTIIAFATLTLAHAGTLAGGSPLARSVCGVIAIFWGARLLIQLFVFDIRPLNVHFLLRMGYHGLTAVFTYLAAIFGYAALAGLR